MGVLLLVLAAALRRSRRRPGSRGIRAATVLLLLLFDTSGCASPPCPGLPEDIPSDWGQVPAGLDTEAWDADVTERMRDGCIPALSVSVVTRDGERMSAAWGYANLDEERPVTVQTPFMIASVAKAVDALAIMAARDDGLLVLDDPVSELVGFEVRNHRIGKGPPIRLHHLATHSSGIQDDWDVLDPSYRPGDPDEELESFLRAYLLPGGRYFSRRKGFYAWPAGREWFYSNVGAALAALAVQQRAGEPFADYCRRRLFEPLGLMDTGWFLADFPEPDAIARPHELTWDGWSVRAHYGYPTWPDGQLRTTPHDLGRLLRVAIGDGEIDGVRLLEPGVRRVLTTPPVDGIGDWYIRPYIEEQYFFWFGMTLEDRWIVGHDGDDYGVSTEMFFDPRTDVGVVLMANIADGENDGRVREQTWAIEQALFELGDPS